jgi:transcriptional regulator with XRE-family HTH domain
MRAKAAGRQREIGPEPVDIHVAMRVRQRRIELGMSQPKLGAALGVTFQQVYKYEKAVTRISAARLYGLSKALGVPITFFFEGISGINDKAQRPKRTKARQQR